MKVFPESQGQSISDHHVFHVFFEGQKLLFVSLSFQLYFSLKDYVQVVSKVIVKILTITYTVGNEESYYLWLNEQI